MNLLGIRALSSQWREEAAILRRRGASAQAEVLDDAMTQHQAPDAPPALTAPWRKEAFIAEGVS